MRLDTVISISTNSFEEENANLFKPITALLFGFAIRLNVTSFVQDVGIRRVVSLRGLCLIRTRINAIVCRCCLRICSLVYNTIVVTTWHRKDLIRWNRARRKNTWSLWKPARCIHMFLRHADIRRKRRDHDRRACRMLRNHSHRGCHLVRRPIW